MGIQEQIISPKLITTPVDEFQGMDIVVCKFTAEDDEQARALLRNFNPPFTN